MSVKPLIVVFLSTTLVCESPAHAFSHFSQPSLAFKEQLELTTQALVPASVLGMIISLQSSVKADTTNQISESISPAMQAPGLLLSPFGSSVITWGLIVATSALGLYGLSRIWKKGSQWLDAYRATEALKKHQDSGKSNWDDPILLLAGSGILDLGTSVQSFAQRWLLYQLTGGGRWSAYCVGINATGQALSSLIAPFIADRSGQKGFYKTALVQALLAALVGVAILLHLASPGVILIYSFLAGVSGSFGGTYYNRVLSQVRETLEGEGDKPRFVHLSQLKRNAALLTGQFIGAGAFWLLNAAGCFFVLAVTNLVQIAALQLMRMRLRPISMFSSGEHGTLFTAAREWRSSVTETVKNLWHSKTLLMAFISSSTAIFFILPMTAFLVVFTQDSSTRFAALQTALVAGPFLLNALVSWKPAIHSWLERHQRTTLAILGASLLALPYTSSLPTQLMIVTLAATAAGAARSMAINSGYDAGPEWVSRIQAFRWFVNFAAEAAAGWTAGLLAKTALKEVGTLSLFGWGLLSIMLVSVLAGLRRSPRGTGDKLRLSAT